MKTAAQGKTLSDKQVAGWLGEIANAKKREKNWRKEAATMVALYEGYKKDQSPFNILYSNTETLQPALYNNTPRPAVNRRFKDKDPLGAAVALTLNRTLVFCMDSNNSSEPNFDQLMDHGILQALVPGRGIVRFKYEADVTQPAPMETDSNNMLNTPAEGQAPQDIPLPEVRNERVVGETVEYDRFLNGYARKWSQVPWVGFEHHMTEAELKLNFPECGDKCVVAEIEEDSDDQEQSNQSKDNRKLAVVYEIWNRSDKSIMFISPGYPDGALKIGEDVLGLSGFFPMEEPLHFLGKISSTVPQPIYNLYRSQAEELNTITRRISAVMSAIKVRGAYASELTELSKILEQDDHGMVPVENIQMLGEGKTLKDALFFMPLAELVSVLQQLYLQRTQIKQVIYEITGISDILRGSSVASETATAQNIKNQWGTLRLKSMQKKVAKWARGNLRLIAEIAANRFSIPTLKNMTQLPYVTMEEQQQAQQMLAQQQQQVQQQALMLPPGSPPPPATPPDPKLQEVMATPTWEAVVELMRGELNRQFRVDIETNSTIADDMAEDQKNIGELLNALSQFLNGVAPLIENKTLPFEVAKTMMLGIVRKMAMGPEIEDQLDKMQPPEPPAEKEEAPPPVDPNIELKAQAEQKKIQLEMRQTELAMKVLEQEAALKQRESEIKMREMELKSQAAEAKFTQVMVTIQAKAAAAAVESKEPAPTSGD